MNGNGAYPDEMKEAVDFVHALRAAVPSQPDPRLAVTLVPRLASTARTATLEAETRQTRRLPPTVRAARRPRSRRALVARVGIAVALIPLVLAGLAVAGVTVPSPARSAFDSIGIDLPNQPSTNGDQGTSGQGTSGEDTSSEPAGAGPGDAGKNSSDGQGNSKSAHEHAKSQREKAKGKATGHDRGKAIGLKDLVPPGHSGDTGPPAHSNAGGTGGGSSNGNSSNKALKPAPQPRGSGKGQTKIPPGQSK